MSEEWRKQAACRGMDPNLFFVDRGDTKKCREARAICEPCPVKAECLQYAIDLDSHLEGVWGGTTERERRGLRRVTLRNAVCEMCGREFRYKTRNPATCSDKCSTARARKLKLLARELNDLGECSIAGCSTRAHVRGLCSKHYKDWYKEQFPERAEEQRQRGLVAQRQRRNIA